ATAGNTDPTPAPTTTSSTRPATTPATAKPLACADTREWGTGLRQRAQHSDAALYLVRAGRHDCYDRLVFDLNGPATVGYVVRYATVGEDSSATPHPAAGQATLEITVRAPAKGFDNQGHQPGVFLAKPGEDLYAPAQLAGWRTLREVRYTGSSIGGQTTFA